MQVRGVPWFWPGDTGQSLKTPVVTRSRAHRAGGAPQGSCWMPQTARGSPQHGARPGPGRQGRRGRGALAGSSGFLCAGRWPLGPSSRATSIDGSEGGTIHTGERCPRKEGCGDSPTFTASCLSCRPQGSTRAVVPAAGRVSCYCGRLLTGVQKPDPWSDLPAPFPLTQREGPRLWTGCLWDKGSGSHLCEAGA